MQQALESPARTALLPLKRWCTQYSVLAALAAAVLNVGGFVLIGRNVDWNSPTAFNLLAKGLSVAVIVAVLFGLGWLRSAWVTTPVREWDRKWPLYLVPGLVVIGLNLTGLKLDELTFSAGRVFEWVIDNLFTGLWEEFLTRSLMLYILYRVWGHTMAGARKAIVVAGVLFGLAHLVNLLGSGTVSEVLTQVTYAAIVGIFFGAVIIKTGSIWPGVIVHALIDMASSTSTFLHSSRNAWGDTYSSDSTLTAADVIVTLGVVLVIVGIPAVFLLRNPPTISRQPDLADRK
ncbi:MAG: lysostaphin resistance A-like protein [Acidimicrobiales bacterium]